MALADPALSKEEQELFEQMQKDEGGKTAAKPQEEEPPKEPAKEEKAAAKAETKEEKREEKMVPAAAVAEARAENKALKKELESMKSLVAEGDKKLTRFIEGIQKKVEEKPAPKFEDDPAAALKHENEELKKSLEEINAKLAKQDQANEQGSKLQQHASAVSAKEAAFAKSQPAYWKAAEYVAEVWRDEFLEAGFDEDKVAAMVFQKGLATTGQALSKGRDPAETIWKLAARFGFKAEQPKDEKKDEGKKTDGETKLRTIEKGMDAAKTAGGGDGPDELTLATLSQMSDEEIDKVVADPDWWAKNVRRTPMH